MRLTYLNNIATVSRHWQWHYWSTLFISLSLIFFLYLFLSFSFSHIPNFTMPSLIVGYAMVCSSTPWCVRQTRTEAWRLTLSSKSRDSTCHPTGRGRTSSSLDLPSENQTSTSLEAPISTCSMISVTKTLTYILFLPFLGFSYSFLEKKTLARKREWIIYLFNQMGRAWFFRGGWNIFGSWLWYSF